jgi:hypothetical protein
LTRHYTFITETRIQEGGSTRLGASSQDDLPDAGANLVARATWRAACLSCGASSPVFQTQEEALRWRVDHDPDSGFPSDIVIECLFRGPGGSEARVFHQC